MFEGQSISPWLSLATQIPIVVAFIYFCIILVKMFLGFLKERDAQWQKWIEDQRVIENEYKQRIAEQLKEICDSVSKLSGKVDAHHLYTITRSCVTEGKVDAIQK